MISSTTRIRVQSFVAQASQKPDIQFATVPFSLDSHEGIAYLLMIASINQRAPAEGIRDLMRKLYDEMTRSGFELFAYHTIPVERRTAFLTRLKGHRLVRQHGMERWPLWEQEAGTVQYKVDRILESASRFVATQARFRGGLATFGARMGSVQAAVNTIATNVYFMGRQPEGARKKTWMFLRWMVRPEPDLGVWSPPLEPRDLRVPLDTNTGRAFQDLTALPDVKQEMAEEGIALVMERGQLASTAANVEAVTKMARWFVPDDPVIVDYAFFCYGRRFERGEDSDRCWAIIDCTDCPIRELVRCPGKDH